MSERAINFFPGPCTLPFECTEKLYAETLDYQNTGMSLWEISHRTPYFEDIHNAAIDLMHEVFEIPKDTHRVLMLGGGGTLQFAMAPMNVIKPGQFAEFVETGFWSIKAIEDAARVGDARVIASSKDDQYHHIPKGFAVNPDARYLWITTNNTIVGTEYHALPETGDVPIFADMSSDILTRRVDWSRIGMAFAGMTKNLGPAGMAVVIVRKDILEASRTDIPAYLQYKIHDEHNSLYNTPPMFCIAYMKLFLEWTRDQGGLDAMDKNADTRANMVYEVIDTYADYYQCPAAREDRSRTSVCFQLPTAELDKKFAADAKAAGMWGLAGHFMFGKCRASLYNGMPVENVACLVDFMHDFVKKNPA